ncbi:MAG: hypothetical protein IJW86_09895 [Clostridia bacterium]|nr:hypothetical protein [Clostridia bacterium]
MNKSNYKEKKIVKFAVLIFIFIMIILPLVLKIPPIKQLVLFMLSFTNNEAYKVAFVEFVGAIIGGVIAICGSVWLQARVDEKEEKAKIKQYACIVYNDLDLAFKDLIKMFRDTELRCKLKYINGPDNVKTFSEVAIGRRIHLSPNWISDVAQLNGVLTRIEIQRIYHYYGLLVEIDCALQSKDPNNIVEIYASHIEYLVSGNERKVHSYCDSDLKKLRSLADLDVNQ